MTVLLNPEVREAQPERSFFDRVNGVCEFVASAAGLVVEPLARFVPGVLQFSVRTEQSVLAAQKDRWGHPDHSNEVPNSWFRDSQLHS